MSRLTATQLPGELLNLRTALYRENRAAANSGKDESFMRETALAHKAFHKATPFFVTEDMFRTLIDAQSCLPRSGFMEYDLPAPSGALYMHHPMQIMNEKNQPVHNSEELLLGWLMFSADEAPNDETVTYPSGGVVLYSCVRHSDRMDFALAGFSLIRFSEDARRVNFETLEENTTVHSVRVDLFRAFCFILRQPLVETATHKADLRTKKRFRTVQRKAPNTRVVSLRKPSIESSGETSEWSHSWIVRGHWRQQWYSSIQAHRPVWIDSHRKGPEDKPFLDNTKVYKLEK